MKRIILYWAYWAAFILFPSSLAQIQQPTELERLQQTYTDNKYYNQVCWLASHNSYAYYDSSFVKTGYIDPNQTLNIEKQLLFGVRGFMIDLYYENDDPNESIILAHSLDEKNLFGIRFYKQAFRSPFLETIKSWLDNNPNDIITIHLES